MWLRAVSLIVVMLVCTSRLSAQPDLVASGIDSITYWGEDGGIHAYSFGATACNRGDVNADWAGGTPDVPVVAQNIYRVRDGRLEQIGMGWARFGIAAINGLCDVCEHPGTAAMLGPGCSNPNGAAINGYQPSLGARSSVNAFTGAHPASPTEPTGPNTIRGRIQVADADIDPAQDAGASYLAEVHYLSPDDAAAGKQFNNVSVRQIWPAVGNSFDFNGPGGASATIESTTAIEQWAALDASVAVTDAKVPADGRIYLAWRSNAVVALAADINGDGHTNIADLGTMLADFGQSPADFADGDLNNDDSVNIADLGLLLAEFGQSATWHYEFAVYNMNSDRAIGGLTVAIPSGTTVTNVGHKDIDHHSGEIYATTDWTASVGATGVSWSTESYASNPNANALRWGTLYNYWFDADAAPAELGPAVFDVFKLGAVNQFSVNLP